MKTRSGIGCVLVLSCLAVSATADTIYVDASNPSCPGQGTIEDPFCLIQDGIEAAVDGDTVLVAAGTYVEAIDFLGKAIQVTSSGGAEATILDAGYRFWPIVTFQSGEGRDSIFEGFTVRASRYLGISCNGASPTIRANVIEQNQGSGIDCVQAAPRIQGNKIQRNSPGIQLDESPAEILDNVIRQNGAVNGAGITCIRGSSAWIRSNVIENNGAWEDHGVGGIGGGILCSSSSARIEDNLIRSNSGGNGEYGRGYGGGLYISGGSVRVLGNEILENDARYGGGAYVTALEATFIGNTFERNRAYTAGGGLFCRNGVFVNEVIAGNVAGVAWNEDGQGGGVYCVGDTTFVNCTISANASERPGGTDGIYFDTSNARLVNTIVWGNFPHGEIYLEASAPTFTYCNVEGGWSGEGNIDADPLFRSPSQGDFRLVCSSPCADTGTAETGVAMPVFDNEGRELRAVGPIDIGADEVGTRWLLDGDLVAGGNVRFVARASPAMKGEWAEVFISRGDGGEDGLLVPGSLGRRLSLDPDATLVRWLALPSAVRRVPLDGCSPGAGTAWLTVPPMLPPGVRVFFAGVTWDYPAAATGPVSSVSETFSVVSR